MNAAKSTPSYRSPENGLRMVVLLALMLLLLAVLLVLVSETTARTGFGYGMFMSTGTVLAASGALLSRSEFVAARQWLRARVAPVAGLKRARSLHLRQLLSIWMACAAPVLLVSSTAAQGIGGPAGLAVLMAGIAAIAEWGQLQKQLLRRAWAAWSARWHWLDGTRQTKFPSMGLLPIMLMQTGSPDTAYSGLPQWGETLDWRYLLRLIVFTLIALALLQSHDLHWRRLLAPGARRRHIGNRILWASLKGNLVIATFATGLALAAPATLGGISWVHVPAIAAGLLPDLLLATMLAVTLRGFAGSQQASLGHLFVIAAELTFIVWVFNPTWHRDGWNALAMGVVMLVLLPLMQRAWLRADLVRLAAEAQEPREPPFSER